jgi:pectate lyase
MNSVVISMAVASAWSPGFSRSANAPIPARIMNRICFATLPLIAGLLRSQAQDGFCMVNGTTTGGAGGPTVTVTNGTDFNTQINVNGPLIIQVQGPISIGRVTTKGNKTIIGLGTNATLLGNLNISDTTNVIVRNLRVTSPGRDGITIWNAQHVWVDHCTFYDTGDGACDMSRGSQYVTVSWCKFHYPTQLEHRFTMIADGYDNTGAGTTNWGYYTLHHNWWSTRADQRMAASSFGRVHYYNNYFGCTNNSYSSNARNESQINSENNFYAGVKDPMTVSSGTSGKIRTSGNSYVGCTGTIHPGTDSVFTPPYAYTLDPTVNVPALVMAGAGAPGPDTVPVPPKVWDGGGANSSLNTSANWGLNESPKEYDTLVFAGTTRLTPNNNYTANTELASLLFSNNAGAFVLGGNTLNFGYAVLDHSPTVQTLNLNLNFFFAVDHYAMNREFSVTHPDGSLVINGNVTGVTNTYNKPYTVAKTGPGLLTLNGVNQFPGTFQFNGGLVHFNQPGNLGTTNLAFNGGGLQWAPGNTADISGPPVTLNTNGAMFDVGANNVTWAGRIGNGGAGGLTKLGTGTLTFNATNNYRGNTLIAQGVLALGANGLLTNGPQIILSNNATFDVSARSDGTQTLLAGRALRGDGTVRGSVVAGSGSTVAPGFSIGTLVITNALTLQSGSTNLMELDAAAHTNDLITGLASVNYGGRLMVTNLNGGFVDGDSFKLFEAGSYTGGFASIVWPPLEGALYWTNKLAIDGTIAVVSPVNLAPTNLVYQITNGMLTLGWPADRISWRLEVQTNQADTGLSTNWTSLGFETTNAAGFPVDAAQKSVFYRLAYP